MKVVAYCRVSTDEKDQLHSLKAQKSFFVDYIKNTVEWEFVGIYADEGTTGTNTKKRKAFNQMIEDAQNHQFDLILTKEVSRFARNTLDSIFYTRQLIALGIGVIFISDNIDTREKDSEFRLTIMASIAQEESRKTSTRIKWGMKRTMEQGFTLGTRVYGYNIQNGKLTINQEEAQIIKLIYSLYLSGMGYSAICKELERRAILSPYGLQRWANNVVANILKNEKYIGTLKQQKHVTIDFLEHKKIANDGREPFIIFENNHEPIIDLDTFEAAQEELKRRSSLVHIGKKHSGLYAFSSKIICGLCGTTFRRKDRPYRNGDVVAYWQCNNNSRYGLPKPSPYDPTKTIGCSCKSIREEVFKQAFLEAMEAIRQNRATIYMDLIKALKKAIEDTDDYSCDIEQLKREIDKIKFKKTKLIELFSDGAISREDFDNSNSVYTKKLNALNLELIDLLEKDKKRVSLDTKLQQIHVKMLPIIECTEFSDEVCRSVLDKVVVYSQDKICFFLCNHDNPDIFLPILNLPHLRWGSPPVKVVQEGTQFVGGEKGLAPGPT